MSSQKIRLVVSVAGAPPDERLPATHTLDCQQPTAPNDVLADLDHDQILSGWPALITRLSSFNRPDWSIRLRNLEFLLENDAQNTGKDNIAECLYSSRPTDHWSAVMNLRSYLNIQRIPEAKTWLVEHADIQCFSLLEGSHTDTIATTWQKSWGGAHPQVIGFVRRHRMELPKAEPTAGFRQLASSTVINALSNRESSTIFDQIWDELPRKMQLCVTDIVSNPKKPIPEELQELEAFGFWKSPKFQTPILWFSSLFAAYVYYTKVPTGILKRSLRWGETIDGVSELLGWLSGFRYRFDKMILRVGFSTLMLIGLLLLKPYTLHWAWMILSSISVLILTGVMLTPFFKNTSGPTQDNSVGSPYPTPPTRSVQGKGAANPTLREFYICSVVRHHRIASVSLALPLGILLVLILQTIVYLKQGKMPSTDLEISNNLANFIQIVSPLSNLVWIVPRLYRFFNHVLGTPHEKTQGRTG